MIAEAMLRLDVATREWVSFAPRRSGRPGQPGRTLAEAPSESTESCPFCLGHEHLTPTELLRVGEPGQPWRVRVVPNLFPAFVRCEEPGTRGASSSLFREMRSDGAHEVLVESPSHTDDLRCLPTTHVEDLLCALHSRLRTLAQESRFSAITLFKNQGARAGTSLRHPHWQIIATPVVPPLLERKMNIARAYFAAKGGCLYSELLDAELSAGARIVEVAAGYVAFVPYAAVLPYQVRIMPRVARASFGDVPFEELRPLASSLPSVLRRLDAALGEPDFNVAITSAPLAEARAPFFSRHLDVLPRVTVDGGFELGSGLKINTALPESAASVLRSVG